MLKQEGAMGVQSSLKSKVHLLEKQKFELFVVTATRNKLSGPQKRNSLKFCKFNAVQKFSSLLSENDTD